MKKKALITTAVAAVLLLAAIAAGLNAIFTVTHVSAVFHAFSEAGSAEASELREKLDRFVGKSTTFLDLGDVEAVVEEYPCFRVDSVRKKYPATVQLVVSERRERYCFLRGENGYAVIDDTGKYLYDIPENVNRAGGENIVLEGFGISTESGFAEGKYFPELLAFSSVLEETLGEIRANILSVTLVTPASDPSNDFLRIKTREGVVIDVGDPAYAPEEKAALALVRYLGLSDENRIFGYITVIGGEGQSIVSDYSRNSRLG